MKVNYDVYRTMAEVGSFPNPRVLTRESSVRKNTMFVRLGQMKKLRKRAKRHCMKVKDICMSGLSRYNREPLFC